MTALRVLAVDDSPVITRLIQIALGGLAEVSTCSKATEALEAGAAQGWDLAIVDMSMPHMSGLELAEAWRRAGASFPVVILSGYEVPDTGIPPTVSAGIESSSSASDCRPHRLCSPAPRRRIRRRL